METIVVVVHVIVAIVIVGLVLLQQGKGADAGASFGAGASQTVFGSSGSGNFLVQATTVAAVIFFVTSLSLAVFARNNAGISIDSASPIENTELLEQSTSLQSDIPQLEAVSPDSAGDVPTLPSSDN